MKDRIGVGSVCEIIETRPEWAHFKGKECTVIAKWTETKTSDWEITVAGEQGTYGTRGASLKLKRPPKDEKFEEFMQNVLKPVEIRDVEVVK